MKFRKITALLLVLCMLLSLSISAFAAEADEHTIYDSAPDEEPAISTEAATSGTIQNSGIRWSLDEKGWLTISGSGEAPVFQSADDQPWAAVREQITEVWFEDVETLSISDLAYWFEGCTNLTTAELPLAPVIGKHAFYNCPKLSTLTMYYGETVLKSIGEDAFWREADAGDTLYIAYIIGYPEATVPFYTYDWAASNRSSRYFYDLYGVYQNADAATTALNGIKKAPGISVQSTGSIIGNCPSCGKYSFQGTYVEVAHSSRGHANYNECYLCHYVQYLGTYTYKSHGAGGYGSGTCPDCGSHTWVLQSQQASTCTSNGYRSYSCACGQTKSETIYASGHNYSYGSWEQYSSSQHRRTGSCRNCGDSDYEYASHSMSYGSWSNSSSSQHSRTASCRTCGYSTTDYGNHSYSTGSWSKYSDTQHRRSKTCSGCGASTYDYANHSYSYGSLVSDSETQHKRTKTCSACGDSGYEYADHTDANGDGKCDDCGATVSLTIKWDAGTNGGTIDGKTSITTTGKPNATATAPTSTPVKAGHAFKGWYTSASGGSLYNTVTITAAKTFYAQFTANSYSVTWDLGDGTTEETKQTYGEAFAGQLEDVLPHGRVRFIRRPLVHVVGVALDGDKAGAGHLCRFRRAEVRRHGIVRILVVILAERDADREDRRFHAVFLQDRIGERVVAEIAVVERDDDRLFRQRLAPQDVGLQLVKGNALRGEEGVQLAPQLPRHHHALRRQRVHQICRLVKVHAAVYGQPEFAPLRHRRAADADRLRMLRRDALKDRERRQRRKPRAPAAQVRGQNDLLFKTACFHGCFRLLFFAVCIIPCWFSVCQFGFASESYNNSRNFSLFALESC